MKKFNLSGVIGWDVTAADLRQFLKEAAGDDVKMLVSSRGGLVGEALEMFNLVRNYQGETTAVLSGYAMSAASYIPLAADRIEVEDNAVYMIHNVHGGVFGDHNYIIKYGNETMALSNMLAAAYSRHTGKDVDEISRLMDEETYFYGPEIVEEGFADSVIDSGSDDDRENVLTAARAAFGECARLMATDTKAVADDMTRAVAVAGKNIKANQKTNKRAATPTIKKEEHSMDLKTLKKEHPDLVAALNDEFTAGLDLETLQDSRPELAEELLKTGAANEVARIKDVRAQSIDGHEELIAKLELDGKSTGADAAMAIVQAEKSLHAAAAAAIDGESNDPVVPADPGDGGKKELKRADFNKLSVDAQRAYVADGGLIVD